MRRVFFLIILGLFPLDVFAADISDALLRVKITSVHRSTVCLTQNTCQALFLIQGKNSINSNGRREVKIGNEKATILRWTDTQITATSPLLNKQKTPVVIVDTKLKRPMLVSKNPVLVNLFDESVDVALTSVKQRQDGSRYMVAGPRYTNPERTYYRDSYWTSGLLLFIEPAFVRDQILLLARGVESNGSVPSAIAINPTDRRMPLWINHYDSGPYFILMVHDYIRYTGDASILQEQVNGRSIFEINKTILSYLASQDTDGNGLPEKPKDSMQDWLDSIPRGGEVFSNEVLYDRALFVMHDLSEKMNDASLAAAYQLQAEDVRKKINERFWNEVTGMYRERCEGDDCVDRLTGESALAILFDVIDPKNRERLFEQLRSLESHKISNTSYDDWGVLNAYPLYEVGKPFAYQNGTDWPFLDGINAGARLKYHDPNWYYPLTRWWTYFDIHRKSGERLPEYVSPVDDSAGLNQAWSVNPAASLLRYGFGMDPDINGNIPSEPSVESGTRILNVVFRGERTNKEVK